MVVELLDLLRHRHLLLRLENSPARSLDDQHD
jgi:hypothetical protein